MPSARTALTNTHRYTHTGTHIGKSLKWAWLGSASAQLRANHKTIIATSTTNSCVVKGMVGGGRKRGVSTNTYRVLCQRVWQVFHTSSGNAPD